MPRNRTISRPPAPGARPFPVSTGLRPKTPASFEESPRDAAISHLRDLLNAGRAGLDPYDPTILIVDVRPHEQAWARTAVELTGLYMARIDDTFAGTTHYRMLVEADVRKTLGLDDRGAPVFGGGGGDVVALFDAADLADAERRLANPQAGLERAVADARDAQSRMFERSTPA